MTQHTEIMWVSINLKFRTFYSSRVTHDAPMLSADAILDIALCTTIDIFRAHLNASLIVRSEYLLFEPSVRTIVRSGCS